MTFQSTETFLPVADDAGPRIAHLRHVLTLVAQLAGQPATSDGDGDLDEAARFSAAYSYAPPIAQRRFDALAAETAAWAATGVEALLDAGKAPAAAAALAAELDEAIAALRTILRL